MCNEGHREISSERKQSIVGSQDIVNPRNNLKKRGKNKCSVYREIVNGINLGKVGCTFMEQ